MIKLLRENPYACFFSSFEMVRALAIQIVIPFFSIILLEKGWSTSNITYFFAIFTFAGFIFSPIVGKFSDIFGYKKLIILGMFFQIIFFLTYYFSNNFVLIYFARFLDGIAICCTAAISLSAFEHLIEEKRGFWTGLFLTANTIGALLGPVIAGYVAENYGGSYILILSVIFLLFSIILFTFLPEKKTNRKSKIKLSDFNPLSEIKDFLKFKELKGMGLLGILMNAKNQIYIIFFPILLIETFKISKLLLGFLIMIPAFFRIFQFLYGKIADKISSEFGVMFGVFIVSSMFFILPYINNIYYLIPFLILFGIGNGIWSVNAWSLMGGIAKKHNMEGEVVGTYVSIAKLGSFFATLFGAYLIDGIGISRTLQLFAIMILIGNFIAYFYFEPIFHHKSKKSIFHKVVDNSK